MRSACVSVCAAFAAAALFAADLPFWGEDNGAGTNVVGTASAVSSAARPVEVRTVDAAGSGAIAFSSYPRGMCIYFR